MKYNWSIEKLKRHRKILREMLKNSNVSKVDKKYISYEYFCLGEMIDLIKYELPDADSNNIEINLEKKKQKNIKKIDKNSFYEYLKIPSNIMNMALDSSKTICMFDDLYEPFELPNIDLTNTELFELVHDFIKTLPTTNEKYLRYFEKISNPNNNLIHFFNNKVLEGDGMTYYVRHPKYKAYLYVNRNNTINDAITLCHEYSHAYYFKKKNRYNYYREVEGYSFEFMFKKFLLENNIIELDEYNLLDYENFLLSYERDTYIYTLDTLFKKYRENKKESIDKIIKYSIDKCGEDCGIIITNSLIENYFKEDWEYNLIYYLSYLISLDLEKLYDNDRELAFYYLENICKLDNKSLDNDLRLNGITFMDDNYSNLKEKTLKINSLEK